MVASKTVGDWTYWLFLYFIACVPAALLGGDMAGSSVHSYNHYHHFADYYSVLYDWEWIAAVTCAVPGFVWVGVCQLRDHRREQAKSRERKTEKSDDASVWPPPPKFE